MALRSGRVGIHPSQVDPITGMLLNGPTPGSVSFEDLSDAQITNPEAGQTLIYNGTGWENEFSIISPTTLAALQDVQITDPADGDYLTYDSVNSKWINSGEAPAPTYTDLTVTMYGAVEDTLSFTDAAGVSHNEVFASGQSSKSVTFKINPSGSTSITFTSAVAKDPDDLTADFSKSVNITDATTEIKVMPDNSLYWYGYVDSNCEDMTNDNGWSGTYTNPTHNTNNVLVQASSGTSTCGIGTKNTISFNKAIAIVKGETAGSGTYGNIAATPSKTVGAEGEIAQSITSSAVAKVEVTNSNLTYCDVHSRNNRAFTLYALWYE